MERNRFPRVYSREWFRELDKCDPCFSRTVQQRLMMRRTPTICTICSDASSRDYAILAEKCFFPIRLCDACHQMYCGAYGGETIMPYVGGGV